MKKIYWVVIINLTFCLPEVLFAQAAKDTVVTLKQCIGFALKNQPAVRQSFIDEQINERDIRIGLSAWLPQVSSADEYQHYFQGSVPLTVNPATLPDGGANLDESSSLGLQASQVIYNNDVLEA